MERLASGDRIGRYRILDPLGSGGDLFVAEDERLSRRVVLELLSPGESAPAPERIVALGHPSIVHLYSVGEQDGVRFATSELVAGTPLVDALPADPPTIGQVLAVVLPVVEAVAVAHAEGVVHGHLSAAELLVADDGRIRVLGFGPGRPRPAHAWSPRRAGGPNADGAAQAALERAAATAPERDPGAPAGPRADVFSLGAVIHRVASGRRPFAGTDPDAVAAAVRTGPPPPLAALRPGLPPALGRIVGRCLERAPERRYRDAGELLADLQALRDDVESRAAARRAADRRTLVRAGAVAAVGVLVAFATYRSAGRRPEPPLAGARFAQLSAEPGPEFFPSLSPDGSMVVYASRAAGRWDVFLRPVAGGTPLNLTSDSPFADTQPAFSPRGDRIVFRSDRDGGGLFVMGATGGDVRRLSGFGWNPAWSPDAERVVFATAPISHTPLDRPTRSELWTVSASGGEPERLYEGDAVQPAWSPNGRRIAFWAVAPDTGHRDVWTVDSSGGVPRRATEGVAVDWSPVWAPDGAHLYYLSDRGGSMNLWRLAIDEATGRVAGEPERIVMPTPYSSHLSLARDGSRLAFVSTEETYAIASAPFDPARARLRGEGAAAFTTLARGVDSPRLSPDGAWVVCAATGATEQEDVVVLRPDGSERRSLTDDVHRDRQPRWSPDGAEIAFYSNRGGSYDVWAIRPDGGGLRRLTDVPEHHVNLPSWSPDGKRMVATHAGSSGFVFDPHRPWREQEPDPLPPFEEGVVFVPAAFSPDGSSLAGHLQDAAGVWSGIAVFDLRSRRYRRVADFGLGPSWLPDGRRLLFQDQAPHREGRQVSFRDDHKLYVVDVETGEHREVLSLPGVSLGSPAVSADGRTLYFQMVETEADIWLLEHPE